jgi:hypothetical protein
LQAVEIGRKAVSIAVRKAGSVTPPEDIKGHVGASEARE